MSNLGSIFYYLYVNRTRKKIRLKEKKKIQIFGLGWMRTDKHIGPVIQGVQCLMFTGCPVLSVYRHSIKFVY